MSEIKQRLGDLDAALAWARRAVAANPSDPNNHHYEATVLLAKGNLSEAEAPARQALELAPGNVAFSRRVSYLSALTAAS